MEESIWWPLLIPAVLIILNAIFASAEIAVISMNDNRIAQLASEGNKRAIRLARLTSQPAKFLATIQVAITLAGFMGSAFAADNFSDRLTAWLIDAGLPFTVKVSTLDDIAVVLITLVLSYFTLVFGELVPKRIAMKKAERLALGMSALVSFISTLFAPLVWILTKSTNLVLRMLGIDPSVEENHVSEEEIRMMVDVGTQKGVIDIEEKEFIQNVFEFDDLPVGEFATHRKEISLLWTNESIEDWEETINESRHSLYPICDKSVDNVVGILNAKDYFRLKDKTFENIMKHTVRPPYFIPETVFADVLFRQMKNSHNHFAVVLDEYGGLKGIVTMNDLLEQLVGELEDDSEAIELPEIEKLDSQTWKIRGSAKLVEVKEKLGVELPLESYDTFGGYVFGNYGSIPDDGSQFELELDSLHIKVIEIKDHRITKTVVCLNLPEVGENSKKESEEN